VISTYIRLLKRRGIKVNKQHRKKRVFRLSKSNRDDERERREGKSITTHEEEWRKREKRESEREKKLQAIL
jgi:hypothetical protein